MIDRFGRTICYLRVSVTDRCNLRCRYCMPADGVDLLPHDEILSFEEIVDVVRAATAMGFTKVRLTGGEPLVRRGIENLVAAIARLPGIADLSMTTNGVLLAGHARDLVRAGLGRVNVSLDTLDPRRFADLTRAGELHNVLAGIEAVERAGLSPIKLNCVASPFTDDSDVQAVKAFGRQRGHLVRVIRWMDFRTGRFSVVEGGNGGDCPRCTRLRLSSDGRIWPCLFSDISFNVRRLGPAECLRRAVEAKPQGGGPCRHDWMHRIGG